MLRAYGVLTLLGLIWGTNFIYMKWATAWITPAQTVFLRVAVGFVPLALMAWRQGALTRAQWRFAPHFAVMSVLATSLYYYGFVAGTALLPTSVAGLLSGASPIFTLLCAWLFLRDEPPSWRMAAGVALGFAGMVLSARPWEGEHGAPLAGVLWLLAGTLSLGVSFVYARRFLSPHQLPPLALATWQTGLATATLLAITPLQGITALQSDPHALWGAIIGLGMLGTGAAFFMYYYCIEHLGPVRAVGATYIAPVVALAIGALVGEQVGPLQWLALALIVGGVVLIQSGKTPARQSTGGTSEHTAPKSL